MGIPWSKYYKEKAAKEKNPKKKKYYLEHAKYHEKLEKKRLKEEKKAATKVYKYWKARGKHKIAEQTEKRYAQMAKEYTQAWAEKPSTVQTVSKVLTPEGELPSITSKPAGLEGKPSESYLVAKAGVEKINQAYIFGREKTKVDLRLKQLIAINSQLSKMKKQIASSPEGTKWKFGNEVLTREEVLQRLEQEQQNLSKVKEELQKARGEYSEGISSLKTQVKELPKIYKGYLGKITVQKKNGKILILGPKNMTPETMSSIMSQTLDIKEGEKKEFILKKAPEKKPEEYIKEYEKLEPWEQILVKEEGQLFGGLEAWKNFAHIVMNPLEPATEGEKRFIVTGMKAREKGTVEKAMGFVEGPIGTFTVTYGISSALSRVGGAVGLRYAPQIERFTSAHPIISKGLKYAPIAAGVGLSAPEAIQTYTDYITGDYESAVARAARLASIWFSAYAGAKSAEVALKGKVKKMQFKPKHAEMKSVKIEKIKHPEFKEIEGAVKYKKIETFMENSEGRVVKVKSWLIRKDITTPKGLTKSEWYVYTPRQKIGKFTFPKSLKRVSQSHIKFFEHIQGGIEKSAYYGPRKMVSIDEYGNVHVKRGMKTIYDTIGKKIEADKIVFKRYGKIVGETKYQEAGTLTPKKIHLKGLMRHKGEPFSYELNERILDKSVSNAIKSISKSMGPKTKPSGKPLVGGGKVTSPKPTSLLEKQEQNINAFMKNVFTQLNAMKTLQTLGLSMRMRPQAKMFPIFVPNMKQIDKAIEQSILEVKPKERIKTKRKTKPIPMFSIPSISQIMSSAEKTVTSVVSETTTATKTKITQETTPTTPTKTTTKIGTPPTPIPEVPEIENIVPNVPIIPIIPPFGFKLGGKSKKSKSSIKSIRHAIASVEDLL